MECVSPVYVKDLRMTVRCGKCLACKKAKQQSWAMRLHADMRKASTAYFITLTYNDFHLKYGDPEDDLEPKDIKQMMADRSDSPEYANLDKWRPKVSKRDLRLFLKRLRNFMVRGIPDHYFPSKRSPRPLKIENTGKFKYFAVAEYGGQRKRPHYHLLILNFPYLKADALKVIRFAWTDDQDREIGFTHIGDMSLASVDYVTNYMLDSDKNNAFRCMSKGIGMSYVTIDNQDYHRASSMPVAQFDGKTYALPKYLKDKLCSIRTQENMKSKVGIYKSSKDENRSEAYNALRQSVEFKLNKKRNKFNITTNEESNI